MQKKRYNWLLVDENSGWLLQLTENERKQPAVKFDRNEHLRTIETQ
jgi:hypothetical protein